MSEVRSIPPTELAPHISAKSVAAALALLGMVLVIFAEFSVVPPSVTAFGLVMLATGIAAWGVAARSAQGGKWISILAVVTLVLLANGWLKEPVSLGLIAIPVILAAVLVGLPSAIALAISLTAVVLALPGFGGATSGPVSGFILLCVIWVPLAMMASASRAVGDFEIWLWDYAERSRDALEEARSRRADMELMREDWVNATRQLALANERLAALRVAADRARQSKADFVAKVSHEFRTPLNIIIGMVDLMVESPHVYEGEFPEKAFEHLRAVHRNSQYLAGMIDDVLDLSRVEAGHLTVRREHVDFAAVVESAIAVVRPLIERKGLELMVSVGEALPLVYCDRTRVRQVVLNLLSNATRLTERGGITVSVSNDDRRLTLAVADTGPGISPEDAQRIFEPFQQGVESAWRDTGGSGLGLSISMEFIRLHGGKMWLESEVGRGTTFYVELPLEAPADHSAHPDRWINPEWIWREHAFRTERSGLADQVIKWRLVLYDENGGLGAHLARYTDEMQLVEAKNVPHALELLTEAPANLLIINASSHLRACEVAEAVGRQSPHTPLFGCSFQPRVAHARKAGAVGYLTKPVTLSALTEAIETIARPIRRVLVVDDEPDAREFMTYVLHAYDADLEVLTVGTARDAQRMMLDTQPDLVFVDILMPDVDGWQLLAIKAEDEHTAAIPAVVVSAQDALEGPPTTRLLAVTIGDGLSVSALMACSRDLPEHLLVSG